MGPKVKAYLGGRVSRYSLCGEGSGGVEGLGGYTMSNECIWKPQNSQERCIVIDKLMNMYRFLCHQNRREKKKSVG